MAFFRHAFRTLTLGRIFVYSLAFCAAGRGLLTLSTVWANEEERLFPLLVHTNQTTTTNLYKAQALGPPCDNSRCFVCHLNYSEERFAVAHAEKGVSCEKCHGPSDAHCSDEDNITAPEIMYPRAKTGPACMACHEGKEILNIEKHKPDLEVIALEDKICTDCHGQHRLPRRSRYWDRQTGRLLPLPEQTNSTHK